MASNAAPDSASAMPRRRKRRDLSRKGEAKRFVCSNDGCGRSFTRGEHLQRHLLNHSTGDHTCDRCRAHFKRRDLLERHIIRHREKDEEAGAEGFGILNTRKRMWKDADGKVVTKKPTLVGNRQRSHSLPQEDHNDPPQQLPDFANLSSFGNSAPISPPTSNNASLSQSWSDHDTGITAGYPATTLDPTALLAPETYSSTDHGFWSTDLTRPQQPTLPDPFATTTIADTPFDDIFHPDTASSFNNPFTTMSNYSWLFDMDLARSESIHQPVIPNSLDAYSFNNNAVPQLDHASGLLLDHVDTDSSMSTVGKLGSSMRRNSPQQHSRTNTLVTPPLSDGNLNSTESISTTPHVTTECVQTPQIAPAKIVEASLSVDTPFNIERPMSLLQPSRSLPIIDELARQQLLDLVDIIQPAAPDGSIIMRDEPLLSLTCMQTYCDLFFTRFNSVYPLIHMSTFDPSEVDTLLLISVLLLGATYGEKDAHQLAVCIHDVLRPQIFANAGFSAQPELWVLQTILLVECFGKSRAGQKQHDMSHLFHGLLINLIRRSDCQSIRTPTLEEATDYLDEDWHMWCDAEQKKRLAFLCFMWDTQHAVLFCQSLCMSAFELRSHLPCDQALWEAESAESWHQLREKQPTPPLFLSCLKMYLHPNTTSVPKHLNFFSRSLLLHGLMSIAWDMQRRDQTSLGVLTTHPLTEWHVLLARAYKAWHTDYTNFVSTHLSQLSQQSHIPQQNPKPTPTPPNLTTESKTSISATLALYHAAHILLHTPFLDLQIYAGSRHILGRPVARNDYARAQRVVREWVRRDKDVVRSTIWHAAALVREGLGVLGWEGSEKERQKSDDIGNGARYWHLPWTLYLGTLVVWGVSHARAYAAARCCSLVASTVAHGLPVTPVSAVPSLQEPSHDPTHPLSPSSSDEIIWDPILTTQNLLTTILAVDLQTHVPNSALDSTAVLDKKGINSLAAVVSRCLGQIRWAVVHDGMVVLRGLVEWRVVGGGMCLGG